MQQGSAEALKALVSHMAALAAEMPPPVKGTLCKNPKSWEASHLTCRVFGHVGLSMLFRALPCCSILVIFTGRGLLVSAGETNGLSFCLPPEPGRREERSLNPAGSWPLRHLSEPPYMMLVQLVAWTWP